MPFGVHVRQSDVGVAQTLDSSDHAASLFPDRTDDLLGHVWTLLQQIFKKNKDKGFLKINVIYIQYKTKTFVCT